MADTKSLFQRDFPPEEFAKRRARVFGRIGKKACAVLQGARPPRGFDLPQQSNQLYYLCGVEVPQAYLLLDGATKTTTLYLPHHDAAHAASEGEALSAGDEKLAKKLTGVDRVAGPEELVGDLRKASIVYTPRRPAEGRNEARDSATGYDRKVAQDVWDGLPTRESHFAGLILSRCPEAEMRDLSPIIDGLRLIKSPLEVELCRRAGRLSGLAAVEAMRSTKPGVYEYELGAIARYIYEVNGARGEGYRAIIAGGANAWYGHYNRNNCELKRGQLVLFDHAPDYGYYTSDIGRMWPVSGKYNKLQRELYGFVVEYHKALLARIKPGLTADQIHKATAKAMEPVIDSWEWSKGIYEQAAREMLEFRGHLSHSVGLAVHDVGGYGQMALKPGIVFTVDPQMWVREERKYIRCEDTVVVTRGGIENLTGFVPLALDDVEALMKEDGMLEAFPGEAFE